MIGALLLAAGALSSGVGQPAATGLALAPTSVKFTYQQNVEPWPSAGCVHKPSVDDPYGFEVLCVEGGTRHVYQVHLALSFYPRTIHGGSGYELLYWVTDRTDPTAPRFTSITHWTHLAAPEDRAKVIEAFLGVENDVASLRLEVGL